MPGTELAVSANEPRWAGRAGWRRPASVLRLPQDVLLEIACLLDIWALLSLRQVCRVLCALSHEPVIFLRLLVGGWLPPVAPRLALPSPCLSPEERVLRACRLHRNWDLAAFPVTFRTAHSSALARRTPAPKPMSTTSASPPSDDANPIVPLPYHLPPGAEAYPFLKLETYAPFRDSVAKSKSSFGPGQTAELVRAVPVGLPRVPMSEQAEARRNADLWTVPQPSAASNSASTSSTPSTAPSRSPTALQSGIQTQAQAQPYIPSQPSSSRPSLPDLIDPPRPSIYAPQPQPLSHFGNFVASTVRKWSAQPTPTNTTYSELMLSLLSYPDAPLVPLPSADAHPEFASPSSSTTPSIQTRPQPQPQQVLAPAMSSRSPNLVTSPTSLRSGSIPGPGSGMGAAPIHLVSPPTPPPAPAPRPTKVSSISVRALFVRVVGGGRWGVFVVKRQRAYSNSHTGLSLNSLSLDKGKGKEKAVETDVGGAGYALTADVLNHFSYSGGNRKGKGKERAMGLGVGGRGRDGMDVARWAEEAKTIAVPGGIADADLGLGSSARESISGAGRDKIGIGTGTSEAGKEKEKDKGAKGDGETFLVVYDLDVVGAEGAGVGGSVPERGQVAEFGLKWTPTAMSCRGTKAGVVIVLVRGTPEGTSYTTILRWPYLSSGVTHLSTHKSACLLGAISMQEYARLPNQNESELMAEDGVEQDRTLVAIVHRPRTVMIQDIDSGKRCFLKLSGVPPTQHRHTLQAVHLIPGPRLLVLRMVQGEESSYVLEEYDVPALGETISPKVPLQRQWIRDVELHSCAIIEGPTYDSGAPPDLALWAFSTSPQRSVMHWILRPGASSTPSSIAVPEPEVLEDPIARDIYALPTESAYPLPAQKISTNKLSFPHHKATIAPGARRAMWFERPERSRTGEARGMRGVWGYTSINSFQSEVEEEGVKSVVRSCTGELPDDVLGAMETNTLAVAFDEVSGRAVIVTCGEAFGSVSGSRVWVLDYA
ncbi:hypothetical protein BDV93DRAFT_608490 [Ceratobasidium sp. AG-I]|nr:hypothetical protein BDV93DRAFT_608490 [Ceratobasidium sp. AG-I]